MLALDWTVPHKIAEALDFACPGEDVAGLTPARLKELIAALPEFAGPSEPPDFATLERVAETWVYLRYGLPGSDGDEPGL